MGIFGQSSPFDAEIEKATSENNTTEPWGLIMEVCDKASLNPRNAKEYLKAIMKRMAHNDPHIIIQAITLLDACVNNCGKPFHLEVASREFENEFKRLLSKAQPPVASKMRQLLKKWAENDFKNDPELNLIPSLYHKLKSEGHYFITDHSQKGSKSAPPAAVSKDPNVVSSQQEEDDIAKAIELSLKEAKSSPKKQQTSTAGAYPTLYPSFSGSAGSLGSANSGISSTTQPEPRKVRALYDFEAAEENELTFTAGEIIHVLDDSDPNWWKGYNQRSEGLFPSNFVTADLSVEPERLELNQKTKKTVQFEDEAKKDEKTDSAVGGELVDKNYVPEIDEEKVDRLLHLLHEANPEDPSQDSDEMLRLEEEVHRMGPLIDAELERVDRKHAQLTQLSSDLVDAVNLYHTLMRDDRTAMGGLGGPMGVMHNYTHPQNVYGQNPAFAMTNIYQNPQASMALNSMAPSMPISMIQPGPPTSQPNVQHQISMPPGNPIFHQQNSQQQPHQQMIPIHYQNGHQNPTQHQPNLHQQNPTSTPQQSQPLQNPTTNQVFFPQQNPLPLYHPQQQNLSSLPPQGQLHNMVHQFPARGVIPTVMMQPHSMPQISNSNQSNLPPFQHQMAAINQPVPQTILGQNDSKTNIPIYQQQR